jgi:uncharacterized repeat protein (TIGR01451 family)
MAIARVWAPFWLCLAASAPAGAQIAVFANVDSAGDVGQQSAVGFGSDGLPLIAYYDATNGDLKVAHCLSATCTTSTKAVIDSAGDVGYDPALAIGADGLGVVAYRDATSATVKVAHCTDLSCATASIATVGTGASSYEGIALAIGSDGLPLVVYTAASFRLTFAHCTDVACSGASVTVSGSSGTRSSLVIGADGLPLFAYESSFSVYFSRCIDPACTGVSGIAVLTASFPPPAGTFGTVNRYDSPSLAVGPDGRVVLVVARQVQEFIPFPGPLRYTTVVLRCGNAACSFLTGPTIATGVFEPVFALSAAGAPLVVHQTQPSSGSVTSFLTLARCLDPACAAVQIDTLGGAGLGRKASIALGPAGIAMVSYYHQVEADLRTAYMQGWGTVDLSLALTAAPDPVLPGQTLHYAFSSTNAAGSTATAVRVRAALPPGVVYLSSPLGGCTYSAATHAVDCAAGSLQSGASAVVARVDVEIPSLEPGPLTLTASIDTPEIDFDPSNNSASVTTTLGRWMAVEPAVAIEGDSGTTAETFRAVLHDTVPAGPPATVSFATAGGSATAGTDYVAASGVITFAPGAPVQTVAVAVVGDTQVEGDEWFGFQLSNPQGAAVVVPEVTGTIVDDDVAAVPLAGELGHATSRWGDLAAGGSGPAGTRHYRLAQAPFTSHEVVVDAASGDVLPLGLARLAADGSTVLQTGVAPGTGASVRLGWMNTASVPRLTELVRLHSGGCRAGCGSDDVYRVRAYDTTLRIPRFNNTGSQVTVLVLQNPSDRPIGGRAWYWSPSGALLASVSVSLASRETVVIDTRTIVPGASGTISIGHDGGYGAVRGKAVSLEPATGLAFDTPVELRPR